MKTFNTWAEGVSEPTNSATYEELLAWYDAIESSIMDSAMEELSRTGGLTIRDMVKRTGASEGRANFLVRQFEKRHKNDAHAAAGRRRVAEEDAVSARSKRDDYLYHVTTKRRLALIKKNGLSPNAPSQFENYAGYTKGKVFFCEKEGISFWESRVEDHEEANNERPSRVVILRVARAVLEDKLQNDGPGSEDSRSPSYYVTEKVPAKAIEVVRG